MPRPLAACLLAAPLLAAPLLAACGEEDGVGFLDFCEEVANVECVRAARPANLCRVELIRRDCDLLAAEGAWDAVACEPPSEVEANNCLNRLSQFGAETSLEAVPPCAALCPDGFF